MDFDHVFGRKFRSLVSKVYGGGDPPWSAAGQAAMVRAYHVNSWLLIPLLKHTTKFYFVLKLHV